MFRTFVRSSLIKKKRLKNDIDVVTDDYDDYLIVNVHKRNVFIILLLKNRLICCKYVISSVDKYT